MFQTCVNFSRPQKKDGKPPLICENITFIKIDVKTMLFHLCLRCNTLDQIAVERLYQCIERCGKYPIIIHDHQSVSVSNARMVQEQRTVIVKKKS